MLFDTIEKVCLKYNSPTEQSTEIQIILSNIFNIMCKAGSIHVVSINMAIIELVSKLLLSDKTKGTSLYIFSNLGISTKLIKSFLFLVTNKLSRAMCNVIKGLLDDEIVNPNIIIEKLPMCQLINVSSPVSINLVLYFLHFLNKFFKNVIRILLMMRYLYLLSI